jgi:hypothetical protein
LIRAIVYRCADGLRPPRAFSRVLDRICDEPRGAASVRITKIRITA